MKPVIVAIAALSFGAAASAAPPKTPARSSAAKSASSKTPAPKRKRPTAPAATALQAPGAGEPSAAQPQGGQSPAGSAPPQSAAAGDAGPPSPAPASTAPASTTPAGPSPNSVSPAAVAASGDTTVSGEPKPGEEGAVVHIPPPLLKPGARYRFQVVSTAQTKGAGAAVSKRSEQSIQLEVLSAGGSARVLRYTILAGTVNDDPLAQAMLNASKDVATDFEAGPSAQPIRLTEWDKVRRSILERLVLDPTAPIEGAQRIRTILNGMDAVSAIPFAIGEVLMMADMQGWPDLAPGSHPEPAAAAGGPARLLSSRDVGGVDPAACVISLSRSTELDAGSPAAPAPASPPVNTLQTQAEVSMVDGWAVRLTQTRAHQGPSGQEVRTTTLIRQDPPACPSPG